MMGMMGMGQNMMNNMMGMGQGMMGPGMNMGQSMAPGQQMASGMGGMSVGTWFGSLFQFILSGLMILLVVAFVVGLVGLAYSFIKTKIPTKAETTSVQPAEVIVVNQ